MAEILIIILTGAADREEGMYIFYLSKTLLFTQLSCLLYM